MLKWSTVTVGPLKVSAVFSKSRTWSLTLRMRPGPGLYFGWSHGPELGIFWTWNDSYRFYARFCPRLRSPFYADWQKVVLGPYDE